MCYFVLDLWCGVCGEQCTCLEINSSGATRYVEINSGTDLRIKTSLGVHAINPEECDVYSSILDTYRSGVITPGLFFVQV
jgi:hypothetical protein